MPFNRPTQALRFGVVALSIAALSACGGSSDQGDNASDGDSGQRSLSFEPVAAPDSDQEKRQILASSEVVVNGKSHAIGYHTLLRSGDAVIDSVVCGRPVGQGRSPLYGTDGQLAVTDSNEHTSLLPIGDRLFAVSQMETKPGAMFLLELNQDKNGLLTTK